MHYSHVLRKNIRRVVNKSQKPFTKQRQTQTRTDSEAMGLRNIQGQTQAIGLRNIDREVQVMGLRNIQGQTQAMGLRNMIQGHRT
jgi:hypothetical protein